MELHSLGLRTELIFHRVGGEVLDRGDYLVVRTPANPHYHWGNMLMFPNPPERGDFERWESLFVAELGDAPHRVYGWDREPQQGEVAPAPLGLIEPFEQAGFRIERTLVLTTGEILDPPRVNREVVVRPLADDDDWQAALELGVSCRHARYSASGYGEYLAPKMRSYRQMQEAGWGSWFGAFLDGRLVADLGLFADGDLARYQSVKTHPEFRRLGICGTAVAQVGRWGLQELGVRQLVMMADPGYHAAKIYESVGFRRREEVAGVSKP